MYLIYSTTRRVHISEVTAKVLNDQFQLEPGNGGDRDDYIRDHKIQTYLVAIPEVYTLMCWQSLVSFIKHSIMALATIVLKDQST